MTSFISAIGTANPKRKIAQIDIAKFMANALEMNDVESHKLYALYRASGIRYRHSVIDDYAKSMGDFEFLPNSPLLEPFPTVSKRMALFKTHAINLALDSVNDCLNQVTDFDKSSLTHLITVSCTGMSAPGLDLELVEAMGLSNEIQRTAINFMGCYAAFNALKMADTICTAHPDSKVLIVCVELCTIHFQNKKDDDNLLANSLFADGAASTMVSSNPLGNISLGLEAFHCDILSVGKNEMAWDIGDFGFEMKLSSYVPAIVEEGVESLANKLLSKLNLTVAEIDFFAIHPGGKKILKVIEEKLGLPDGANKHAYQILRKYGNMSSPTILFVLKELISEIKDSDRDKNILSFAFGPGLTLESMLLKVV